MLLLRVKGVEEAHSSVKKTADLQRIKCVDVTRSPRTTSLVVLSERCVCLRAASPHLHLLSIRRLSLPCGHIDGTLHNAGLSYDARSHLAVIKLLTISLFF